MSKRKLEPLPCPFCGKPPEVHVGMMVVSVHCGNPRCKPVAVASAYSLAGKPSRAAALRWWNRRAG